MIITRLSPRLKRRRKMISMRKKVAERRFKFIVFLSVWDVASVFYAAPVPFQPKRVNHLRLPTTTQDDLRDSNLEGKTEAGYEKVCKEFISFAKIFDQDYDDENQQDEHALWSEGNLLGFFTKLRHEQNLKGSTLWGRFAALSSRFKLFGASTLQKVYPTLSTSLAPTSPSVVVLSTLVLVRSSTVKGRSSRANLSSSVISFSDQIKSN